MSTAENTATEKRDVYATVTAQIVSEIEQGVSSWRMPWHTSGRFAFSPVNVTSKKPYRGINTVCLWAAAQAKSYERGEWGTYRQWQERGAQVRKGEKSTCVVFWKFANSSAETQENGEEPTAMSSRLLFTRGYWVFNAAQVDGYTPNADPDIPAIERIEQTTSSRRTVGIPSRTARELREWMELVGRQPEAWVFASENPGKPMWRDNVWYRNMKPRLEPIGLGWANFQVLRRTHASLGHEVGIDPKVSADQRGHGIGIALDVYTQSSVETRREAAEVLESSVFPDKAEAKSTGAAGEEEKHSAAA